MDCVTLFSLFICMFIQPNNLRFETFRFMGPWFKQIPLKHSGLLRIRFSTMVPYLMSQSLEVLWTLLSLPRRSREEITRWACWN